MSVGRREAAEEELCPGPEALVGSLQADARLQNRRADGRGEIHSPPHLAVSHSWESPAPI